LSKFNVLQFRKHAKIPQEFFMSEQLFNNFSFIQILGRNSGVY
jgi:hypothetical protein